MAQLSPYRIVPVTEFRRDATKLTNWVLQSGGRVWITKHGTASCAVVPMFQCELLEKWEGRSLAEERRRLDRLYARWKAVKASEPGTDLPLPWDWEREW
ncbi:hypothetical protein [Thalassovita aquimarina]|uniref:Antitoxin n=1 Tax=Thalassovita aquimarina TaxID=2785917 RepID=A0ABS5HW23_9RHOB|nr:hypothetical protein [Thalassovita aquimarina]MBR9653149.1 hypothetical protein [Thalassovita aquimarina]